MNFDLSNLTAALSALGSLVGLASKANTVEFNQQVIEVQKSLLALQSDVTKLLDENRNLKEQLEMERSYSFHHSVNWKKQQDGSEFGPLCPVCLSEGKVLPLQLRARMRNRPAFSFECAHDHGGLIFELPGALIPKDRYTLPT